MADNLSQGRTAISIATGWHPNDFVFAPDAYKDRRQISLKNLEIIQRLWRGEAVELPTPGGESLPVKLHPLPKQRELPVWLTCIHKESYAEAGRNGLNVLGYLMNQTVDELAEKIAAYREGRRAGGHDAGHVTTLLFTYFDESVEKAQAVARGPLCAYLRAYLDNSQKKIEKQIGEMKVDEEDIDYLTNRSCDDYFNGKSLIGTPESCGAVVERLKKIGVDEIGCFVDFGVEAPQVLESLRRVSGLIVPEGAPANDETLPLTESEQGLWLLAAMNEDAGRAYRESVTLTLDGDLDRASLDRALQALVDRHGALRTTIDAEGKAQTVLARHEFKLGYFDYAGQPADRAAAEARRKLAELENQNFEGMRGPFLHGHLFKLEAKKHLLVLFFHHVVGNGPSYWVALDELAALYGAYRSGQTPRLPAAFPFAEFVEKRRDYQQSPERAEAEKFWLKQMEGGGPGLDLPYDHPLPPALTYIGARQETVLPPELTAALKKVGAAPPLLAFHGPARRLPRAAPPTFGAGRRGRRRSLRQPRSERKRGAESFRQHHQHAAAARTAARGGRLPRLSRADEEPYSRGLGAPGLLLRPAAEQAGAEARSLPLAALQRRLQPGDGRIPPRVSRPGHDVGDAGRALPEPPRHGHVRLLPQRGGVGQRRDPPPVRPQHRPDRSRNDAALAGPLPGAPRRHRRRSRPGDRPAAADLAVGGGRPGLIL